MDLVERSYNLYMLEKHEKRLIDIYPNELFIKYDREVREMAKDAGGRKLYRKIVAILRKMEKYPDGREKV